MEHPLDNPIWHALTGEQRAFAIVGERAARYREDVSPLCAVDGMDSESLEELADMTPEGLVVLLLGDGDVGPRWQSLARVSLTQWVCGELVSSGREAPMVDLGADDASEMLALARTADPGPFELETHRLGDYVGVRADDRLVAMAGERICFDGYREVSAVATLPGYEGRGYAQALVEEIVRRQHARSCQAFLHVRVGSPAEHAARRVYEKLGFELRAEPSIQLLRRQ